MLGPNRLAFVSVCHFKEGEWNAVVGFHHRNRAVLSNSPLRYLGFHHRNRTVLSNTHRWDTSVVTATSRLTLRNEREVDGELTSICTRRKLGPIRWDPAYYKTQGWSHGRHRHRASGHHLSLFPPGSSPNSPLPSLLFYRVSMPTKLQPEKRATNAKSMFQVPKSLTQLRGHELSQIMIQPPARATWVLSWAPQPLINWPLACKPLQEPPMNRQTREGSPLGRKHLQCLILKSTNCSHHRFYFIERPRTVNWNVWLTTCASTTCQERHRPSADRKINRKTQKSREQTWALLGAKQWAGCPELKGTMLFSL